jgi:uncharacterized linocin/CFP29 family protein
MTNHLLRELAPVPDAGWEAVDSEAKRRLTNYLAARKLVEFDGPAGWTRSAVDTGRIEQVTGPCDGVTAARRRVSTLVELRVEFTVSRDELYDAERGASDIDLDSLDSAAEQIALAENMTVFNGYEAAGIVGITQCSSHEPISLGSDTERYPNSLAMAVDVIRRSGIDGPYGLAVSPDVYTRIIETTEHGGYPLLDHLRQILGGPVVWTPGIVGGVVLSLRGEEDFVLHSGQDISIGYLDHDAQQVRLYFEESFTFKVNEPDASVTLRPS